MRQPTATPGTTQGHPGPPQANPQAHPQGPPPGIPWQPCPGTPGSQRQPKQRQPREPWAGSLGGPGSPLRGQASKGGQGSQGAQGAQGAHAAILLPRRIACCSLKGVSARAILGNIVIAEALGLINSIRWPQRWRRLSWRSARAELRSSKKRRQVKKMRRGRSASLQQIQRSTSQKESLTGVRRSFGELYN